MPEKKQVNPPSNTLPQVEVTASAPAWLKYRKQFEKAFPIQDRIRQYLTPMARSLGNSMDNYPQRIDQQYEKDLNNFVARNLLLDRNSEDYTDKEKQIISGSDFNNKSKKYAYNNPVKLPVSGDDPWANYLYAHDYMTKIPGARQAIQYIAGKKISQRDIEQGYQDKKEPASASIGEGDPMDYAHNKVNMLSQYLRGDQGLEESKYAPKNDFYTFLPTYSLKNKLGVTDNFQPYVSEYLGQMDQIKEKPVFLNGLGGSPYKNQADLGHFKSGVAWDGEKNLPYYFVQDAWDFDPSDYISRYGKDAGKTYQQAYLLQQAGNPFKVYDRFYFSPEDGNYINDSTVASKAKFENGGTIKKKGLKARNGISVESIPTGFVGDPTALQQPIPNIAVNEDQGAAPAASHFKMPNLRLNAAPAMLGLASIVNQAATAADNAANQSRYIRIQNNQTSFNPLQYGDGSEVLFRNGGSVASQDAGIMPISDNRYSSPLFQFYGPSHERGGIPITYNGQKVEVEGEETGYVDQQGDMNIFGNLKVPGQNMKFKTAGKKLAEQERLADKQYKRAERLLPKDEPQTYARMLRYNSAKVQMDAASQKQKDLSLAKEQLSKLQEETLASLYSSERNIAEEGIVLPGRKGIDPWGLPDTPGQVLEQAQTVQRQYPTYLMDPNQITRPVTPAGNEYNGDDTQNNFDFNTPTYNKGLNLLQYLPEMYALATNRQEAVPSYNFSPDLLPVTKVNFSDRLQENNNTFRSLVKVAGNNPAALSQLAAGKYQADNGVLADQFRTNIGLQAQQNEQNIQLLNQAKLQNLASSERTDIARSQNAAATRSVTREALKSLSAKAIQQKQANIELSLINQSSPYYSFDTNAGQWISSGRQAPIFINGMPVTGNSVNRMPALYGDKEQVTYTRDGKGKLVERVKSKIPAISSWLKLK